MSKLIAVCGGPDFGKTTVALKMAQEIYRERKGNTVVFLSPDLETPSLGFLFPNGKDQELHSVGKALDKTDIFKEDVMKQFVNVKTMLNFAFLGFKLGENKYSYPQPTEDKINQLFSVLRDTAEYIVVDCTSDEDDLISRIAKRDCDVAVQLFNPDIRCMVYYASCVNQFISIEDRKIRIMNIMDADLYLPIDETKEFFGVADFTVPYSRPLKQQTITGELSEKLDDSAYRKVMKDLATAVMSFGKAEVKPPETEVTSGEGN